MDMRLAATALLAFLAAASIAVHAATDAAIPPTAHRLVQLGDALEEKGEHKDAIADYNEAIADYPDYAYAYASRCQSEWALDQNEVSIRDCKKAIALDPSSAYAYRQLGMTLNDTGDKAGALAAVDQSLTLDSSLSFTFAVRCQILIDLKRYDDATTDCNRAIKMDPKSVWGHQQLGRAELENGDYAASNAALTWVIGNDPASESARYNRALARLHTPNLSGALQDIEQYIGANPTEGDGYYTKARIERALNDKSAAAAAATEALRLYKTAGDEAGKQKTKDFIASNDLESSDSTFAGVLGGLIIVIVLIFAIALSAIQIWGLWRILDRAGLQGPLALLCLVPLGLFVCLGILAFSTWNVKPRSPSSS